MLISLYLFNDVHVYLSIDLCWYLSLYLFISTSICLCLSIYLFITIYSYLFICSYLYLFIPIYLSIYPCSFISLFISVFKRESLLIRGIWAMLLCIRKCIWWQFNSLVGLSLLGERSLLKRIPNLKCSTLINTRFQSASLSFYWSKYVWDFV